MKFLFGFGNFEEFYKTETVELWLLDFFEYEHMHTYQECS